MTNVPEQFFTRWFQQLSNLIAPAQDIGILNYIFQPVPPQSPNNQTLLKLANFSSTNYLSQTLKQILIDPIQKIDVYEVIRTGQEVEPKQLPLRHVFDMIAVCAILLLIVLVCCVATCGVSCCCWWEKCCLSVNRSPDTTPNFRFGGRQPSWSFRSVRAALHEPAIHMQAETDLGSLSTWSSDLYVNQPTVNIRQTGRPALQNLSSQNYESVNVTQDQPSPNGNIRKNKSTFEWFGKSQSPDKISIGSRCSFYILVAFNFLFLLILMGIVSLNFYTMAGVKLYTVEKTQNDTSSVLSLQSAVPNTMDELIGFFEQLIDQGVQSTQKTLETLQTKSINELNRTTINVVNSLLKSYKVQDLFDLGESLAPRLNLVTEALSTIRKQQAKTIQGLSTYKGEFGAYVSLLASTLTDLCDQLNQTPQNTECARLRTTTNALTFNFDVTKINLNPCIGLAVLMERFQLNASSAFAAFDVARQQINKLTAKIVTDLEKQFKIDQFFSPLKTVWQQINDSTVKPFVKSVNRSKPTAQFYTNMIANGLGFGGYVILGVYQILLTVQVICLCMSVDDVSARGMLKNAEYLIIDGREQERVAALIKLTPVYGKHLSFARFVKDRPQFRWFSILLAVNCICFFLSMIVCLTLIVILTLVNSEICQNFTTSDGLNRTDRVIELYLKYEWPNIINEKNIPKELFQLLVIKPPSTVSSTIAIECNPTLGNGNISQGLLGKLGYRSIFTFTSIIQGSQIKGIMEKAENDLVMQIKATDFKKLLPDNMNSLTNTLRNITQYIDKIPYEASIEQLSHSFLPINDLPKFCQDVRSLAGSVPMTDESRRVISVISSIEQSIPTFMTVTANANRLATHLKTLKNNQNLTVSLQSLVKTLADARAVVTDPVKLEQPIRPAFRENSNIFLQTMDGILQEESSLLIQTIVPCGNLYNMFNTTMNVLCTNESMLNSMGTNCMLTAVSTLFLCIGIFIFVKYASKYNLYCDRIERMHASLRTCVAVVYDEWRRMKPRGANVL